MSGRGLLQLECSLWVMALTAIAAAAPPHVKNDGPAASSAVVQPLKKIDPKGAVQRLNSSNNSNNAAGASKPLLRTPNAADFGFLTKSSKHPQPRSQTAAPPADANPPEIALDGSLGPSRPVTAVNGVYTITSDMGQIHGPNLFQSFSQFNLSAGETASFTGPSSTQNVLARVTGGSPSNINGTLQCTIPSADFYLINPAGVIFGSSASLDVKGSFAVTTTNVVNLSDGGQFNATGSPGNLTSAPPSAFGFLSSAPASVQVQGSSLTVGTGQSIAMLAGSIQLQGATLTAPGGRVTLAAAAPQEQLSFTGSSINSDVQGDGAGGAISIMRQSDPAQGTIASTINVDGDRGGRVFIRGSDVLLQDSTISAKITGFTDGPGVSVNATGTFSLVRSTINTSTSGAGSAGPIDIVASSVLMDGTQTAAQLIAETSANPIPAAISVTVDITHPATGDLTLDLGSPSSGTSYFIGLAELSLSGANLRNTTFDDRAPMKITQGSAPYTGTYRPDTSPLGFLDGQSAVGTWTLAIGNSGTSVGTLNSWSLSIGTERFSSTDVPLPITAPGLPNGVIGVPTAAISTLVVNPGVPLVVPTAGTARGGDIHISTQSLNTTGTTLLSTASHGTGPHGTVEVAAPSIDYYGQPAKLSLDAAGVGNIVPVSEIELAAGAVAQPTPGNFLVSAQFGQQQQQNLFFSFTRFDLGSGDSVTFGAPASPPSIGIQNVLARVNGGASSVVDGTIHCQVPGANFYLLNPAGIIFGPGASLDLSGAFAATTADSIMFADGKVFGPGSAAAPTGAATSGFAFTSQSPAPIVVQGATSALAVSAGEAISLVGGNLYIYAESIAANGGRVNLVSAASPGQIQLNPADPHSAVTAVSAMQLGSIEMTGGTTIDASDQIFVTTDSLGFTSLSSVGKAGGSVIVRAGSLQMGDATIAQGTYGSVGGGGIDIGLTGAFSLSGLASLQTVPLSSSLGVSYGAPTGKAGDIRVTAGAATLDGTINTGGQLSTAGSVAIDITGTLQINGSGSFSTRNVSLDTEVTEVIGSRGGNVDISAGNASLDDATVDARSFLPEGLTSTAGNIHLNATGGITLSSQSALIAGTGGIITIRSGSLSMTGGSEIDTSAAGGQDAGGTVDIQTSGDISLTGSNTAILSRAGVGNFAGPGGSYQFAGSDGGAITLTGAVVSLTNGAQVSTSAVGGTGGNIQVSARSIVIDGTSTSVAADTGPATLTSSNEGEGGGSTSVVPGGNGGSITLTARQTQISDGATVSAATTTAGKAGNINIVADAVALTTGASVLTSTSSSGAGGGIQLSIGNLILSGNASVSSASTDTGAAGTIAVVTTNSLTLSQAAHITTTSTHSLGGAITVSSGSSLAASDDSSISASGFEAGKVTITTATLSLSGGSTISTDTVEQLPGQTSDVSVRTAALTLNDSRISASTSGGGVGGDVRINPLSPGGPLSFLLTNGSEISASAGSNSSGAGGSVTILATNLSEADSQITASSTGSGAGGDVTLNVKKTVTLDHHAGISATAANAAGGDITLTANSVALSGGAEVSTQSQEKGSISIDATGGDLHITDGSVSAQTSSGQGGNVTLSAPHGSLFLENTTVSANADNDGNITVDAAKLVFIQSSRVTARAMSNGGLITIDPLQVILDQSTIDGRAGKKDVKVQVAPQAIFLPSGSSRILSDNVSFPPETDVAAALAALPSAMPQTVVQLAPVCAPHLEGNFSSFVATGQGGRPPEPGGWLPDLFLQTSPLDDEQRRR